MLPAAKITFYRTSSKKRKKLSQLPFLIPHDTSSIFFFSRVGGAATATYFAVQGLHQAELIFLFHLTHLIGEMLNSQAGWESEINGERRHFATVLIHIK